MSKATCPWQLRFQAFPCYNALMAYDGIITYAVASELQKRLILGKIDKIHQPTNEDLILQIHTKEGNVRLLASCGSQSARVCLTQGKYVNPEVPPNFCMLLRKHIQGGRITDIRQYKSERIIEMDIEAQTELGFTVSKRLIFEIMGKHSNIVLVAIDTGKIIDSIKRISIDVNRYRQLLPGVVYQYPPEQDKISFRDFWDDSLIESELGIDTIHDPKYLMSHIAGISPAVAREMASSYSPSQRLGSILRDIEAGSYVPRVYVDENDNPREFHITELSEYEPLSVTTFGNTSECVEFFYTNRSESNIVKQKAQPLYKSAKSALEKAELKKKRLSEDLMKAEDSDKYRLYGELLTANLHLVKPGARSVTVLNYYTGENIDIPLDEKINGAKNSQHYFKKYAKAKTAIKEKAVQLEDTEQDIKYLESVLVNIEFADSEDALDQIREELAQTGYVKRRQTKGIRKKKDKPHPIQYTLSDGNVVYVGRNNIENDWLTTKFAGRMDVWFHTKDIPGSHVILPMPAGEDWDSLPPEPIYEAASIAAYHSKAGSSENVPVDFVQVRHVKKPAGAKPGMVIFTHNTTVWVDPKLPEKPKK